jgi:hypothetical protein
MVAEVGIRLALMALGFGLILRGASLVRKARASWEERSFRAFGIVTTWRPALSNRGYFVNVRIEGSGEYPSRDVTLAAPLSYRPAMGLKLPLRCSCVDANFALPEGVPDKTFVPGAIIGVGGLMSIGSLMSFFR